MDTAGLHEHEATGWKLGLYEDVMETFRAPVVNAVIRVPMATHPEFVRYVWGEVKPIFTTRAFGEFTVAFRDAILSGVEETHERPTIRPGQVDVAPGEFRELRGQIATFDVVAPRLVTLFGLLSRGIGGESIGATPDDTWSATAPLPADLDRDRGLAPTLLDPDRVPNALSGAMESVRTFYGFTDDVATVHYCLAQWPPAFEAVWAGLEPILNSAAFDRAADRADAVLDEFLDSVAYRPKLAPDDLERAGFDADEIEELEAWVRVFPEGPPRTVVQSLPLYAAALDAEGPRTL